MTNAGGDYGYDPYGGGGGGGGYDYSGAPAGGDQQYAGDDPFAYTSGSLLTPWQGRFDSGGYGGGYSVPDFQAFNYADFGYTPPSVGRFEEKYEDPAAFRFADFQGPSDFKAPTAEDMQADPGYQVRMDAVSKAQRAGAAHGGVLRTGGYEKGLAQAVGNQASQEYGNVYGRRAQEHDRRRKEAEGNYGINQGNTFQAFNTNVANKLAGHQTRQQDWRGNADVGLQEGQLGFQVAQGTWDRNYAKAKEAYDAQQANRAAQAAASAGNAGMSYERDLADYNRARDEFWTNQDRQNALTTQERDFGYMATQDYANRLEGGYGAQANNAIAQGDARAGRHAASGAAWGDAMNSIGNTAMGGAAYYGMSQPQAPRGGYQPPPPMQQQNRGAAAYGGIRPPTYSGGQMGSLWGPQGQSFNQGGYRSPFLG